MPGIVVFRRRWSVGSDDLVVPGAFLFVLHLIWVTVLGVLLGILQWDRSIMCIFLLWEYILGYLVLFIVSMAVEFSVCFLATRGSILDTAARAPMQYILYIRLFLLLVEAGWLCAGVTWLTRFYQSCPVDQIKDVMLGLVISNWCVLAFVMVTVWCTYDAAGRSWVKMKKYQRSMREAESRGGRLHYKRSGSRNRNWRQRKVIRAYQDSWDNRCRLLFCCMGNSDRNRNSFADIARLLSDFFRDLDVVPSDVVAGLVLLRKFQKIERELIVKQKKNDTYEFLSGVPVTPRTKFLSLTEDGDLGHFQLAIHYMHFALAAYGWPMFLVNHSTGLCQLCTRLRCACFPCGNREDEATIVEDNCCQCNYAALRKMVEVGEVEVVYATFHVDVGETPFFVALDYSKKKVVVSIRGTLSMKDVLTDLNAEGEVLPLTPPKDDWLGHKGMVQAAEYIRKKLQEENIIARALSKDPSRGTDHFGLTLVGHSLGAGTAAILAILLRQEYPDLICFSFAPPGGLLSMPAQQYSQEFTTSVVVGKDVVPRIGLRQMESLRADLINAIKRSVDPKWKTIACSVMCCGCSSTPTSAANMEAGGCISEYQRDKDLARSQAIVPTDSSIALTLHRPLFPPGRIIHVVRHHPNKGEKKYESRWRQVLSKREPVYQALWAGPCDFDEVLISPVMIQDHMPDNMLKALNKVVTTLGPAKPQRLASGHASSAEPSEAREPAEVQELEIEQEMRALLSPSTPVKCQSSNLAGTPPHKLCLETSFTSLQSPTEFPQAGRELSVDSRGIPWEYVSLASDLLNTPRPDDSKLSNRRGDWEDVSRTAPLATPETLSETSSNPPSPIPPPRPMRRTPKIPGNLSTAADDLKNNLHFAMLSAKNYFLREENIGSNSSSGNSEASYESAKSLTTDLPPPVPRRRDSVTVRREQRVCTAACCRDDLSENSSTRASSHSSRVSRTSHHVQVDFPEGDNETNGSSLDFFEAKGSSGQRDSSNDVFLSVRSSPECKGLMAPATDLGAEWKRRFDATGISGDASLPLLRGLSPTPTTAQHSSSPFFNAKRKKYVYPITLMGRGESSV
ncbi:PREDICTED: sn1-specific diacylglycerol lipase alpha isoform X1 [Polistes canadensis]|uniref:sn1-specific diacylglycerol lipase alpha isoform X1 n=1 Tax=Polistes canadensis TaxID=91411 RepID=UPI000718DFA4|nr:PREDICTED: sn1-specific diacylglycerol lipase alpha isoform X1 [Polistes canadensis]XP_014605971.1 PREDICTED: sn1-specific diacylglycerol lipase alpha isoform X1 [Polistes canadensis]XP_014605972.1 PREDICTED: sn1-specific diacylglycerol lipase alpha isoform X1 [Polistes canadensis]XP_014605973.1 PREDICTED: sn1-specific diacylglycerol lipase alpha isoform X1 [Polistes canadensis]XP_014605974.1 PREDICTED: sn1-specific diacylglycerol lipase alpha isoform X1 [Polistes canadensis]